MTIKGTLAFYGWYYPWILKTDSAEKLNMYPSLQNLFTFLSKKGTTFTEGLHGFKLAHSESASNFLKYEPMTHEVLATLVPKNGVGTTTSIVTHVTKVLERINGRKVCFIYSENAIEIAADPKDTVFTLVQKSEFLPLVPADEAFRVCKVNTDQVCIFSDLSLGSYSCTKVSSTGEKVLRKEYMENKATGRIGDCLVTRTT